MKIKNKLLIGIILSITFVVIVSSVMFLSNKEINKKNKEHQATDDIRLAVSELDIIMYEYLLYHEERMIQQWNSKYDSTAKTLAELEELTVEESEEELITSIRDDYTVFGALFSQVTAAHDKRQTLIQEGASQEEIDETARLEEIMVAQMLTRAQRIITSTTFLSDISHKSTIRIQSQNNDLISFFRTILVISITFTLVLVGRSISKPLDKLVKGAEKIGKGNFEYRIDVKSKDEMGELGSAFNRMAADLKKSRDKTERYGGSLEKKVAELTKTKTAMLNMTEDLDSTNKKLLETQKALKKNFRSLESLDKEKDAFISISAHELKTPITAIHGFAQLLENEDVIKNPEMRKKYLKIIDQETKRLGNLVTEILDLSRIDLNTVRFTKENINLYEVLESIKEEEETKIKSKDLKIILDLQKDLPIIYTDKEKVTQVLINLIDNAMKYTPKGAITVKVIRKGDGIQVSVSDTGLGIPKESFKKIFTRFYQVDSSYTRKVGGSGLGLSICKEFINALGGRIWFESKVGKGSTFYFTLPIRTRRKKL
ncbi:MAG: ATP-binding protein [Candidatus Aenigmatarchaeota archaeon]